MFPLSPWFHSKRLSLFFGGGKERHVGLVTSPGDTKDLLLEA